MVKRERVYLFDKGGRGFLNEFKDAQDALMAIIESSYDGIYITDGNANTIYINRSYQIISGLSEKDVLGKNMHDLEKQGVISRSGTLMALKKQGIATIEQEFKTGKRVIITSTPIFDKDNKVVMVVTNVRDVSELYSLKEELEKSSEIRKKYHTEIELMRKQVMADTNLVAVDDTMLELLRILGRVAKLDTPILLLGETGVGKERIAAYVHNKSGRRKENYIKVNCGAIAEGIIESELFGYEPGAFTGANKEGKIGFFGVADKGTIFLDEVGDLPPNIQVKLLRVLQEQEITRVGAARPIKIDIRILAATNRNLEELVREGKFRQDLYYRLNVFPVTVPPLRERKDDIPELAELTLMDLNRKYGKSTSFSPTAVAGLWEYHWPGNVRELKNVVERAFIMCDEDIITAADLPIHSPRSMIQNTHINEDGIFDLKGLLEQTEFEYMNTAYEKHGNIRDAAKSIGLDYATFSRKRNKYKEKYLL